MTLLAERPILGYPGATVELHVTPDNIVVRVCDPAGVHEFIPTSDRKQAKDMYFHPFVYGYVYQPIEQEEDDA